MSELHDTTIGYRMDRELGVLWLSCNSYSGEPQATFNVRHAPFLWGTRTTEGVVSGALSAPGGTEDSVLMLKLLSGRTVALLFAPLAVKHFDANRAFPEGTALRVFMRPVWRDGETALRIETASDLTVLED